MTRRPAQAICLLLTACTQDGAPISTVEQAAVPTGFTEQILTTNLFNGAAMEFAPDGRLFIAQQGGEVRVWKNGALNATNFIDLNVDAAGERGLLGIAFDPSFATNNYVYLQYVTPTTPPKSRISRFTANGDVAAPGSEVVLVELDAQNQNYHIGGAIHFGTDGYLYVATGDNGVGSNAQSLTSRMGKILRYDRNGGIPTSNPFYGSTSGVYRAIWAYGLRNPFVFDIDRRTNRMFINDVGEGAWEEVDDGIAGANYGWPATEGATTDPRFRSPFYTYNHGLGTPTGCAITGGVWYEPAVANFPTTYNGKYFFADFCNAWIWTLDPSNGAAAQFATNVGTYIVDMKVGPDGALYYLGRVQDRLVRVSYSSSSGTAPLITSHPANTTVTAGRTASFTCAASGTAPLSYQWQRGTANIAGATSATYSLTAQTSDNGAQFRCVVGNAYGSATSNYATLTVTTGAAPVASITAPATSLRYAAGDTIAYSGSGTDAEDGTLPASAFTWRVDFQHDTHFHPFIPDTTGATSGSFTIPTRTEVSANVWYRIYLTVRDSSGQTSTVYRDVLPRTSQFTLASSPAGLQVTLDGMARTAGFATTGVVGVIRSIGAVSPQTLSGRTYVFSRWSDSGAATHDISTPASNTTYTATFVEQTSTNNGLDATYYSDVDLRTVALQRVDPNVNFDWGSGSPAASVPSNLFSARWTGKVEPQYSQTYTFYTYSDDGVRLWVNGVQVINNWTNHAPTENRGTIALTAGQRYDIRLEYFEGGGNATIKLSWSSPSQAKQIIPTARLFASGAATPPPPPAPPPGTGTGLRGDYYADMSFGTLVTSRTDAQVSFDWGTASPAAGVPADAFSVRWTGQVEAAYTETHTFYTQSDDAIRLWVDNVLLVDNWTPHASTENSGTIALAAGQKYAIRIDYFEQGGSAVAKLSWSSPSTAKQLVPAARLYPAASSGGTTPATGNGLRGSYYSDMDFVNLAATRTDATVDFDWGTAAPMAGMPSDAFAVRWTGQVEAQYSQTYTFYTQSDDGVRLWVNNVLLVDNWAPHASAENSATIALTAGQKYAIRIDYYEQGGSALARLSWSSPSITKQVVPQARLYNP